MYYTMYHETVKSNNHDCGDISKEICQDAIFLLCLFYEKEILELYTDTVFSYLAIEIKTLFIQLGM